MDREVTSSVLVLAVLLVMVQANEIVMQLSGELRAYPESMIKARIMRGVISPKPRVNSKGMRYWVQIARDNVDDSALWTEENLEDTLIQSHVVMGTA